MLDIEAEKKTAEFSSLSWNCEGLKNGIHALAEVLSNECFSFISLSETQLYKSDILMISRWLEPQYKFFLNSGLAIGNALKSR